jgi:hypothetical protein
MLYGNANTPCGMGQTYYRGNVPASTLWKETAQIEGMEAFFEDLAPRTTGGQVWQKRSGRSKKCRLVRNVSVGELALAPKMLVTYASGYQFKRVNGNVAVNDAEVAGIVDEHLPAAGAAYGDLFWITVDGPTLVKGSLGSDTIATGDLLLGLTAATTGATTSGRVYAYAVTSDTTTMSPRITNRIGWAVSAKTSGQTNADLLANIRLP